MTPSGKSSAHAAERGIALAGEFTGPVVAITGDDARIELHAGTEELGDVLELVRRGARVHAAKARKVPLRDVIAPFAGHLDRESEARQVLTAAAGRPVGLVGEAGAGKTFVLAHALAAAAAEGDGVVYRFAGGLSFSDVLFGLYLARYDCDALERPSDPAVRERLHDWKALVVLDGIELPAAEAQQLAPALPECRIVAASREPSLWDAEFVPLAGLEPADAVELLAHGLGRMLAGDELEDARALCIAAGGHPGRIRQAAWAARTRGLRTVAAELEAAVGERARADIVAGELTAGQRAALSVVAAAGGASVAIADIHALADEPVGDAELHGLEEAGLIARNSPRYRLAGGFAPDIARDHGHPRLIARMAARLVDSFAQGGTDRGDLLLGAAVLAHVSDADTVALGRALDPGLTTERLWGARRRALERVRDAAHHTGATADESWALHQLGTLLVCLGERTAGLAALRDALSLRDGDAARVTRHNLHIAGGGGGGGGHVPWGSIALVVAVLLAGSGVAVLATSGGETPTEHAAPTTAIDPAQTTATTATGTATATIATTATTATTTTAATATATATTATTATTSTTAAPTSVPITVTFGGDGAGTVTSQPPAISCSQSCTTPVPVGTQLRLTATAAAQSRFEGWSGPCSGTGVCDLTADHAREAVATFAPAPTPR